MAANTSPMTRHRAEIGISSPADGVDEHKAVHVLSNLLDVF